MTNGHLCFSEIYSYNVHDIINMHVGWENILLFAEWSLSSTAKTAGQ